ncbi:hypothetical protein PO909_027367 [Leuciscus waleckii]
MFSWLIGLAGFCWSHAVGLSSTGAASGFSLFRLVYMFAGRTQGRQRGWSCDLGSGRSVSGVFSPGTTATRQRGTTLVRFGVQVNHSMISMNKQYHQRRVNDTMTFNGVNWLISFIFGLQSDLFFFIYYFFFFYYTIIQL